MDINECEEQTHNCNQQAVCLNTKGSFQCSCLFGLQGSGVECYKAGYYDINQDLWQRMGVNGNGLNARGLVQFNSWGDVFAPDKAGFASWSFSDEFRPSATHKGSYGLAGSMDELMTCQKCLEMSRVEQRQCSLGAEIGSPDCPAAKGLIHLAGMALTEHVHCSWEFFYMPYVEFHVTEFHPVSNDDTLQFCYGLDYAPGESQHTYETCHNFSISKPPPKHFFAAAPCAVTIHAVSAFALSPREPIAWSSMSPSTNRFTMSYVAKKGPLDQTLNIDRYFSLPKYQMTTPSQELAIRSAYMRVSISNYVGPHSRIPCSLNHQPYHDFSSIALEPSIRPLYPALQGSWRGTCKSLIAECKVDVLFFGTSSIQIMYTGCSQESIEMPTVQTAVYSFADSQEREARRYLDQNHNQAQWLYRRMHLVWTGPSRSPVGSLSKASLAWPVQTSFDDISREVLLHILPSGTKTERGYDYPGDWPELLDVQQQDCAVILLDKLTPQTDLPPIRPPRAPDFSVDMALFLFYAECNSTIGNFIAQWASTSASACGGLSAILQPNGADAEMSDETCRQECVATFQTELMSAVSTCKAQWEKFLEVVPDTKEVGPDAKYLRDLERRFVARLGFLGDLLMRIQLSCHFGLFHRSCMWVNNNVNLQLASVCPHYRSSSTKDGSFFYVLPEYTGLDNGMQMCASCTSMLRQTMREGHCCISTALNLKRRLLDLFLPGAAVSRTVDLFDYLCLFHSRCDAGPEDDATNLITISKEAVASCVAGSGEQPHLKCLSSSCALGYTWPTACCQWHACENEGSRCVLYQIVKSPSACKIHVLTWDHTGCMKEHAGVNVWSPSVARTALKSFRTSRFFLNSHWTS